VQRENKAHKDVSDDEIVKIVKAVDANFVKILLKFVKVAVDVMAKKSSVSSYLLYSHTIAYNCCARSLQPCRTWPLSSRQHTRRDGLRAYKA
jgi:hypothetical protein